jgi:hypothetical protein
MGFLGQEKIKMVRDISILNRKISYFEIGAIRRGAGPVICSKIRDAAA